MAVPPILKNFYFSRRHYSRRELLRLGFWHVGSDVSVSKSAQFHGLLASISDGARIDDYCVITGKVEIGRSAHVSPFVFLSGSGGCIRLMDGSGVGSHSSLFTKSQVYDLLTPRAERHVGDVEIGTSTILGRNVTVLPGVSIGRNCVIGAGCVISESIGDHIALVSYGSRTFKKDG